MPKILEKHVSAIKKSSLEVNTDAVAISNLQKQGLLKKGTKELTKKGEKKNK